METVKIYPPQHQGGGIVFCSKCEKSFIDNSYYEFCPRCGCRIRNNNFIRQEKVKEND